MIIIKDACVVQFLQNILEQWGGGQENNGKSGEKRIPGMSITA